MLSKYVLISFINIFLFLNSPLKAEANNYIIGNNENNVTQRIDNFFIERPNDQRVFWVPKIKGKSRFALSIPRDAYLTSKKYADASDLYYLAEKIDNGLKFYPDKSKNVEIYLSKNKSKIIFTQKFFSNINAGIFLEQKEKYFGIILDKDFILSKNDLGNLSLELGKDGHTAFKTSLVKLAKNEDGELFGSINYKFKSDNWNTNIGYTWFEIVNQFDFTACVKQNNNKVTSEFYASIGLENVKLQIGLNQIRNNSDANIFLNLKLGDIINKKYFGSQITISSKKDVINNKNLSLKKYRKQSLDSIWRNNIRF